MTLSSLLSASLCSDCEEDEETKESIAKILEEKYRALGNFSKLEFFVMSCLLGLFVALLLRSEFATPYALPDEFGLVGLQDTTLVFVLVLVFFATPQEPCERLFSEYVLEWSLVQRKVPWSAFITYGGGLCVAGAIKESGLLAWLSSAMMVMRHWHPVFVQLVLMLITTVLTEVNNDTAAATVLIPIACDLAESTLVNPLYYGVPVTVACSTGLLLPVCSLPMALVHANLIEYRLSSVLSPVFFMKGVTILAIFVSVHTTGSYYYSFNTFPQWANKTLMGINSTANQSL
ncbi:solute carrier family 13 member 5-like [Rhipicephalus sanguineus]|uniref:solute carrier family 13 member 5-like n=1 Tax=Rhipicephalus sanguineus TaxID=34632 RepID=UPI0020C4B331|nr:solute carrier family 13 member 5-like [Rhipicephalus sanguineus]